MRSTSSFSVKRNTRTRFVVSMKDKTSRKVRDALNFVDLRRIWMFHTDRDGEFLNHMDQSTFTRKSDLAPVDSWT